MISFESKLLYKLIESGGFYSKILDLEIDGKHTKVLPKDLQYDPVSDNLIHFDFLKVQENTKVSVEVPVNFLNQDKCPGLKKGGVLNIVRRLVELICNANNIRLTIILLSERIVRPNYALNRQKTISRTHLMRWHPDCLKLKRALDKKNFYFFYSPPKMPSERNRKTCQENLL